LGSSQDCSRRYRFRFALAAEFFAARWLANLVVKRETLSRDDIAKAGRLLDRHTTTVDTFLEKVSAFLLKEPGAHIDRGFSKLFAAVSQRDRMSSAASRAQSALVHLALNLASVRSPSGPKIERTEAFVTLLGGTRTELRELRVEGLLSALDLSGTAVVDCLFRNAGFVRCRFSTSKGFEECVFEGSLVFQGCEGLAEQSFAKCRMSPEATVAIQQTVGAQGAFSVSEIQIRDGLRDALRQMGAPSRFHPIDEPTRRRGKLAASVIGESIWDALIECGAVEEKNIGRGREGSLFSVKRESVSSVVQFMNSGLATGSVACALETLKKKHLH